jgi:hypothetical protein
MTALTDREFLAELDAIRIDNEPNGLPARHVQGECDTCGTDTTVRVTPEGLACDDCYDADPQPYDFADCDDRADNGWGW